MGFVGDFFDDVIDFFDDVIDTVINAVADMVNSVVNWIEENWVLVALITVAVVALCTGNFAAMASAINANAAALAAEGASWASIASVTVGMYAEALYISVGSFLGAIHFSTLLAIHQVAYLVSDDYRILITSIYNDIAAVSGQLGLGTAFLLLAHRNARNIVLDASTMMGHSYDLAEITWLNQYVDYLKKFNIHAINYQNNPGAILHDIDEWVIKPATDFKAGIVSNLLTSIDAAAQIITETVNDITTLRNDFGQFLSDLPAQIRDKITPYVDDIFNKYDTWIRDDYKPTLAQFDNILDILGRQQIEQQSTMSDLVARLLHPADYLREIDKLPPDEREEQERALYELTTRPLAREIEETTTIAENVSFDLLKMIEALGAPYKPPAWLIPEVTVPGRPPGAPIVKRKTWFVGDF